MQEKSGGSGAVTQDGYGLLNALITAFLITIPMMLVLAAFLTFTDFPEKYITFAVLLATFAGLFIAGFKSGMNSEKNGMVKGALVGFVYMAILYLLSSIVLKDFMLNTQSVIMIFTGILAGAIGALMGIRQKSAPASRAGKLGKLNKIGNLGKGTGNLRKYRGL